MKRTHMTIRTVRVAFDLPHADFVDLERRAELAGISVAEMARQLLTERLLGLG
jgi:hypothetical protein